MQVSLVWETSEILKMKNAFKKLSLTLLPILLAVTFAFLRPDITNSVITSAASFLALTDTPTTYVGSGSQCVAVNAGATGLEFIACDAAGVFTSHTDTPANYSGASLQCARVNAGETAIEFAACGGGAADGDGFTHTAGTDADTPMTVNNMYVVDVGAFTADRTYTLPATCATDDRVGVIASTGDDTYELLLLPNTGDTINNGVAATEWSRLFIAGETVVFRCVTANTAWVVEVDGRIPSHGEMQLSANFTSVDAVEDVIEFDVADQNIGNIADTTNFRFNIRRGGIYNFSWTTEPASAIVAGVEYYSYIEANGTTNILGGLRGGPRNTADVDGSVGSGSILMSTNDTVRVISFYDFSAACGCLIGDTPWTRFIATEQL